MAGEIHDGLRTHADSTHHLLHLEIVILHISRHTEVYIDLRPKHRADTLRIQAGMVLVCADRDLTLCHQLTKLLLRHMLLLCDDLHLWCDDTLPRRIHLCCIILHIFSFFLIRDQPSSVQPPDHGSGKQRFRILGMPCIMIFLLNI